MSIALSDHVLRKAELNGTRTWVDALPALVAELERDWELVVGPALAGATEAYVAEATLDGGAPAVLKLMLPRPGFDAAGHEIAALLLAAGSGCARLLRHDVTRGALLLERLGPSLADAGLPVRRRQEVLTDLAARIWRPASDCGLPTGAEKARALAEHITRRWEGLGGPCSRRAVDHALRCCERREAAHDPRRARLVHGDVHQWNALARGRGGWALVDPDGLLVEPEYDLGVIMREDPLELVAEGPGVRAAWLAARTGLDPVAIGEWGAAERVSTGLLCMAIGLEPVGSQMLRAAEAVAPAA